MDNPVSWVEIVNSAGIIGILIVQVWLYSTGKVISRPVVDKILNEANQRTTKLADEIKEGIKDAVKGGIVEGIHEVRSNTNK